MSALVEILKCWKCIPRARVHTKIISLSKVNRESLCCCTLMTIGTPLSTLTKNVNPPPTSLGCFILSRNFWIACSLGRRGSYRDKTWHADSQFKHNLCPPPSIAFFRIIVQSPWPLLERDPKNHSSPIREIHDNLSGEAWEYNGIWSLPEPFWHPLKHRVGLSGSQNGCRWRAQCSIGGCLGALLMELFTYARVG